MNFPAGSNGDSTVEAETWVDREVAGCGFRDERLAKRFRKLLGRIGSAQGGSLTGHFQSTRDRIDARSGGAIGVREAGDTSTDSAVEQACLGPAAGDLLSTDFAGRHLQYEHYYTGPACVVRGHNHRECLWVEIDNYVSGLIVRIEPGLLDRTLAATDAGTMP
jgi:hypothetical protein